ncbi:paraquat-inducible protein A [Xylophilus sp. Kf1]|nr:paraquat-inducible protein A [Xylophilus sp. Kf1]
MIEVPEAIVCESCDAVCQRRPLRRREVSNCPRCGAELERDTRGQQRHLLPLTVASLFTFAIANLFPIVEIELRGLHSRTTLAGAVMALVTEGRSLVAVLVAATTLVFPLFQLLILLWLLVPLQRAHRAPGFALLVNGMQLLRPWGMVEVFLLGVLVALVKLAGMAKVIPGPALWAFAALTILLTAVLSFDPRGFWRMSTQAMPADPPRSPA